MGIICRIQSFSSINPPWIQIQGVPDNKSKVEAARWEFPKWRKQTPDVVTGPMKWLWAKQQNLWKTVVQVRWNLLNVNSRRVVIFFSNGPIKKLRFCMKFYESSFLKLLNCHHYILMNKCEENNIIDDLTTEKPPEVNINGNSLTCKVEDSRALYIRKVTLSSKQHPMVWPVRSRVTPSWPTFFHGKCGPVEHGDMTGE